MVMSHIAAVRGYARLAGQRTTQDEAQEAQGSVSSPSTIDLTAGSGLDSNSIDCLSLISVSNSEDDLSQEMNIRKTRSRSRMAARARNKPSSLIPGPLDKITSLRDISIHVDGDLDQINALNRLEQRWKLISTNFQTVLKHLKESSDQVRLCLPFLQVHSTATA